MSRIRNIGVAIAAISVFALTACTGASSPSSTGDSTAAAAGSKGALAMSFAGLDVEIWNDELAAMKPLIEDAGYTFLSDDPAWDIQTQVADVENWIARGDVKAIMAYPVQSDSMNVVTGKAVAAGIPVVGYAVKWDGVDYGLVVDNYADGLKLGEAVGEWVVDKYGTSDAVPITLFSYSDNDLGRDRTQGTLDGLKKSGAKVDINEIPALNLDDGYAAVQSSLAAKPDTKVYVSISGDAMAGGYQALIDSGVSEDDPDYLVASLDATALTYQKVVDPNTIWRITYGISAQALAENNAKLLISAAEGTLDADISVSSEQITSANVAEFTG